ncbi:MAG TPA: class I SAM-dependent methyltransferase [Caulobacteraceae bacterium]|jgi:SAM-dependent methyltransferase|nr:class I SAM-dependent methyltransferase [Caulobacteraceae bacterium]
MTQNVYDQPAFFDAYSRMRRSVEGLDGASEWPAVRALIPDLRGRSVVDLGCGYGWFCRWAREQGAARVVGLDVSERMLAVARGAGVDTAISYELADLETVSRPAGAFDLAHSSLAFHYVEDAARLYAQIRRGLSPGGRLVFSTEHPIYMAPTHPGWTLQGGVKTWPVDGYLREGPRTTDWLGARVIKHHRTIGTTLGLLIQAGFTIEHVEEFCPTPEQIAVRPDLADEVERPMFLIIRARA